MSACVDKARAAIARVEALGEAAGRLFTEFDPQRILADAAEADARIAASATALPLAGLLVSVKDLYDEKGARTTAASKLLRERAPAEAGCPVVARIKAAGAVPFGRTTMSEFAYSGVGLNPHYGTPGNVFDADRIPGGSTSGGGVSVALGLCDLALGTDTGGSVRIPSAINGLYGFKPSQGKVPLDGVHPLAASFDTAGPLARDFATMLAAYKVMSEDGEASGAPASGRLRLAVPENAFTTDLDDWAQAHFNAVTRRLAAAGHELVPVDLGFLQAAIGLNRILVSVEAHRIYGAHLQELETVGDPRVLARIRFSETVGEDEVQAAYQARREVVARFAEALAGFDAMIAPTLQRRAPTIAETEANFDQLNAAMLRNTSLLNLADACALSMPTRDGAAPATGEHVGALMVGSVNGRDAALLAVAARLDADLAGK
ncbi:amidase family protein [Stappia indica]|uniref:amidase family protein n=1 Tax=Stappia indica TaxID=538381 RepID=UPI001CD624FF|nr:amidase family protein [Stappia indica]MCA1298120.1 amidase [Stappia indica]